MNKSAIKRRRLEVEEEEEEEAEEAEEAET